MEIDKFYVIGENIHCTRSYRTDGKFVQTSGEGSASIVYKDTAGKTSSLPMPQALLQGSDWQSGKVRHAAAAIWQGMYGSGSAREKGCDYLLSLALRQQNAGAAWLDINVDEFSTDTEERCKAMRWVVELLNEAVAIPLSIDSSNTGVLRCGLESYNRVRGVPMINSVSLERADAVPLAAEHGAAVIASAAGESELPCDETQRIANLEALMERLASAGISDDAIYIDPLVFPVATDSNNARSFLDSTRAARERFGPHVHLVGGFSNVSFGMPSRKLINQVFSWLAVQYGADGGIVDPFHINRDILCALDPETEAFGLARALLLGEDEFGVNYISAHREGKLA